MRKLYLEGLHRLRSLVCVLLCSGSSFANEITRLINLPRRYGGRSNDHGSCDNTVLIQFPLVTWSVTIVF